MTWTNDDNKYMALALQLAKKGVYTARPNPMVGCVIVNKGQIIGQGFHQKYGQAHAEINALSQAVGNTNGATCYVTLEPCSHDGKTGPCADSLIRAGITEVVAAMQDPNPEVSGKGFEKLTKASIVVRTGLMESQAVHLNRGYISKFSKQRPWVSLKLAMSLDGRTALADGSSHWITGAAAREDVQKLRARQDGIITGMGTLVADNPSLNVRGGQSVEWFNQIKNFQQPTRIVLDKKGEADITSKLFNQDADVWWVKDNETYHAVKNESDKKSKIENPHQSVKENIHFIRTSGLEELLRKCANQGMNQVLVEAGHKLAGQFLEQGLVDEIIIYLAPKLMGNDALGLFNLSINDMKDCPLLNLKDIRQFGDDVRLIYVPKIDQKITD